MPGDSHLKVLEGDYLSSRNDQEQAMRCYEEAVRINPALAEAYFRMGILYSRQGEPMKALPFYERAVLLSPSSPQYRTNLADQYFKRGDYDQAIAEYMRVDQFPLAALESGEIYRLKGDLGTAGETESLAIEWLQSDKVMRVPENQLPWFLDLSDKQRMTITDPKKKLCYARLELSATLFLQGKDGESTEQSRLASAACGSLTSDLNAAVDWELSRVAAEKPDLASRTQAYMQRIANRRFDLSPGTHELTVSSYDDAGNQRGSVSATINVPETTTQMPRLHVVSVGISNYRDHSLAEGVKFAAADARAVMDRLQQQSTGLFSTANTYGLFDEQATRDRIGSTLSAVASKILPADVFVLYLSGHGTALDG